jgi:sugar phosphate isomerase/epimerase
MKIGIQTRPWGPDMNRENLTQILAEISGAGYDGFEIGAQHLDISKPDSLRQLAASHGLQVVGIHVGGEIYDPQSVQAALENLERIVAYAKAVGASFVPFSGRLKEQKTEEELGHQAENLNRIGQLCDRYGLRLCYHNHFWEIENDCAELHHICDQTDPELVSLCLDVGWVERAGGSPVAVVERFFERIGYFHIKDTTAEEWMEVGYGAVDFPALFQVIQRRQDWWLVVEQDETRRQPVESARMSRDYLRAQLRI